MPRFIMRYKGAGAKPADDVRRIRRVPSVDVVDETPRMVLVESDAATATHLAQEFGEWSVAPDTRIPLPDTRHRVKRSP
ncbi:MAG TPA: hypothetical protein VFF19_10120 [Reyranella sp.]|jgi:hypothetical protein|nr:hypothetical protein [Reyranella sp.]